MKVVAAVRAGGPDVLEIVDMPEQNPAPGQVLVEVAAAGVNFMDIGVRRGQFWTEMGYPMPLGVEGAGRVLSVGEGVTSIRVGQRVAWVYVPGSYAERVVAPAEALVPIPDGIDDHTAAAVMMQGLTASHFATDFYPVQPGDIALVHAAAGGVGLLLTQIIKLRGGTVIGRVSRQEKVEAARAAGADHVIVDAEGNFAGEVIRQSGGDGVHVVYDGSGPATFQGSLDSLRRSGTFCWFGPVLGAPGAIELTSLPRSIKIGYAVFSDHIPTPEALQARSKQLFDWILADEMRVTIGANYPLADATKAHADMEARGTTGKLLLIPGKSD
ncbi:Quinone oxidoreductase [plant metagenome]|uniref:Quinone oxidoreductase n=1 Tax=plant metagenome TaxID=1297885 RepID=A0A484SGF0_9ZZZZ